MNEFILRTDAGYEYKVRNITVTIFGSVKCEKYNKMFNSWDLIQIPGYAITSITGV